MWTPEFIADLIAEGVARRDAALREEQAVYGLDALNEVALHPVLSTAFGDAGYGVLREQPYPTQWKRKRAPGSKLPLPRDRERCDVVLTPRAGQVLRDSLAVEKAEQARRDAAVGTLFEPVVSREAATEADRGVAPDDAYWLEVKVVAQFSVESGVPGPNHAYGSQLGTFAARDIGKLSADRTIIHGGLALVLFTADQRTAEHDSGILFQRLLAKGLRVNAPVWRSLPILDRIGNALCSVVLIPLRPAPPIDE